LLHQQKALEYRGGLALEQSLVPRHQQLVADTEALVDRAVFLVAGGVMRASRFCSTMVFSWNTAFAVR